MKKRKKKKKSKLKEHVSESHETLNMQLVSAVYLLRGSVTSVTSKIFSSNSVRIEESASVSLQMSISNAIELLWLENLQEKG